MPTYRKNFLTSVVFRLDFNKEHSAFSEKVPATLDEEIRKVLTSYVRKEQSSEEITLDRLTGDVVRKSKKKNEFNYYGNEQTKRLVISDSYFFVEFKKYLSWDDFKSCFTSVLNYLEGNIPALQIKRVGLRYINNFSDVPGESIYDWTGFLNSDMIAGLNLRSNGNLYRNYSLQEYVENDFKIVFQYGMINPDYPSNIVKKQFTVDTDVSKTGDFSLGDFSIEDFHSIQERFFELSITNNMRAILNAE